MPLLSICIPTFNRASLLNHSLARIENVKHHFSQEIEVCVANNASTDNTREVCQQWLVKFDFKYIEHQINIGFSNNLSALMRACTGEWIIFCGDDDLIIPNQIPALLAHLREGKSIDWTFIPFRNSVDRSGSWLSSIRSRSFSSKFMGLWLLHQGVGSFGFIGCHLIKGTLKEKLRLETAGYSGYWIHVQFLYTAIAARARFETLNHPIFEYNPTSTALRYTSSIWFRLWISRTNGIHSATHLCNGATRLFFMLLLVRELLSFSQFKEISLLTLRYPITYRHRLKLQCTRQNINTGLLWVIAFRLECDLAALLSPIARFYIRSRFLLFSR